MGPNRLLNLLARNRRRGEFKAESGGDTGNTIWLYDVIVSTEMDAEWCGGVAADTFAKTLLGMSGPVTIRVNSPGGDVFAGRAMAQAIRDYAEPVTVQVDGCAASAATFITSAADRTVMAPGAMLMIHKAWTVAWGNADEIGAVAALLGKIDGTIAASYAASATKRGVEPADFAALMAAETWMTEQEAIEMGLADEILQGADKSASAQARARWDLSAYAGAPAAPPVADDPPPKPAAPTHPAENSIDQDLARRRRVAAALLKAPA